MPKYLYLVRHAKSSWKDPSLGDRERPLNGRGRRSAPDMGKRLAAGGHRPDLIISSPAKRAFSTAKKIAGELAMDKSGIITDESMYFSGTGSMVNMLEKLEDNYQKVMIVGHNPAMTSLLDVLSESSVYNMPTCAVALIAFDIGSWSELGDESGNLLVYDFPKNTDGASAWLEQGV
jgi:phosphohistidine phosphatase